MDLSEIVVVASLFNAPYSAIGLAFLRALGLPRRHGTARRRFRARDADMDDAIAECFAQTHGVEL